MEYFHNKTLLMICEQLMMCEQNWSRHKLEHVNVTCSFLCLNFRLRKNENNASKKELIHTNILELSI